MIQRIQSIYLLVTAVLGVLLCCFPMASAADFTLKIGCNVTYSGLIVIMPLLSLVTIFLYKKRILQMRLCSLNIVINALTMVASGLFLYLAHAAGADDLKFYWPTVIMPINIILLYLAVRAIGKDEALVRSLDRLR